MNSEYTSFAGNYRELIRNFDMKRTSTNRVDWIPIPIPFETGWSSSPPVWCLRPGIGGNYRKPCNTGGRKSMLKQNFLLNILTRARSINQAILKWDPFSWPRCSHFYNDDKEKLLIRSPPPPINIWNSTLVLIRSPTKYYHLICKNKIKL